jgi:hypothetical protein
MYYGGLVDLSLSSSLKQGQQNQAGFYGVSQQPTSNGAKLDNIVNW